MSSAFLGLFPTCKLLFRQRNSAPNTHSKTARKDYIGNDTSERVWRQLVLQKCSMKKWRRFCIVTVTAGGYHHISWRWYYQTSRGSRRVELLYAEQGSPASSKYWTSFLRSRPPRKPGCEHFARESVARHPYIYSEVQEIVVETTRRCALEGLP